MSIELINDIKILCPRFVPVEAFHIAVTARAASKLSVEQTFVDVGMRCPRHGCGGSLEDES